MEHWTIGEIIGAVVVVTAVLTALIGLYLLARDGARREQSFEDSARPFVAEPPDTSDWYSEDAIRRDIERDIYKRCEEEDETQE